MLMGWVYVMKSGKKQCRNNVGLEGEMEGYGARENSTKNIVDKVACQLHIVGGMKGNGCEEGDEIQRTQEISQFLIMKINQNLGFDENDMLGMIWMVGDVRMRYMRGVGQCLGITVRVCLARLGQGLFFIYMDK